ncbi:hypothetical protein O3P69_001436 [Scylla paramamosain]|uniref:Complex 1 LYR protein domain-containing protein n=1 Tax=Scylla paramamosain TaxID=85552 RepID=A0AAW0UXK8_SCYPA
MKELYVTTQNREPSATAALSASVSQNGTELVKMARHSKIQLEVLRLYKQCLRAAEKKPGFYDNVQYEFRKNATIPKTEILRVEHLLRQGWRKLKMMQDPFVNSMGRFQK